MKDRPILFSGAMVRALLAGTKTQTRRIVKPQHGPGEVCEAAFAPGSGSLCNQWAIHDVAGYHRIRCPFGRRGDRLWVRETFTEYIGHHVIGGQRWAYAADCTDDCGERIRQDYIKAGYPYRWKPSIHMPRVASRILLEITEVRVQRLQEISEEDALAEGISHRDVIVRTSYEGNAHHEFTESRFLHGKWPHCEVFESAVDAYADLWESLHGAGSWAANPHVWAISFRRVTP